MIPAWDTPRQRLATRTPTSVALAVIVGLAAGAGAVVFRWMIRASHDLLFGAADRFLPALGEWRVAPLPAIGGLIVGLLVFYLADEARGSGIPEVMLAVAQYGGKIRARVRWSRPSRPPSVSVRAAQRVVKGLSCRSARLSRLLWGRLFGCRGNGCVCSPRAGRLPG